ncbi:hypothetical protein DB30_00265 [Enhygromyxa salina]|uniref:VWA domain-containing protein n=1 Tax=Enhygromyxa salina TaxID=215803 RepID=A0A0C2DAP0_9BACT|nr:hypothetical protein [Enhygromyxa salina]KIG18580.1 hypothetical protein DB30_00265 [Enhygromyxa salina]
MTARESMSTRLLELEREDLLSFINAALACTGQDEFYGDATGQALSIGFFHAYVLGNYRRLYAHCLAAGINDFNRTKIIFNLLTTPAGVPAQQREQEGRLIAAALPELPPPRVYRLLEALVDRRVNNRRTRRIVADYLAGRRDPQLHALKYRRRIAKIAAHFHLRLQPEESAVLFNVKRLRRYQTPLFETFRRAHYEKRAVYELPYTVAEGLAARHKIPRETFLRGIAPRLTTRERLRLQSSAAALGVAAVAETDLSRHSLTRLAIYFLSLSLRERTAQFEALDAAMQRAAQQIVRHPSAKLGRVALVADNSYSSRGSGQKRKRPLALALAAHYLLGAAASELTTHWTWPIASLAELRPRGHTDLATPILNALALRPELLIVVSDGYDNDPPGGAAEVVRVFRERLDPKGAVSLIHLSPSYDAGSYMVKSIHPAMHSLGIRDVEGIPTLLTFVRFAAGSANLHELQDYLQARAHDLLAAKDHLR